jgi:predicted acylesterase/phospholipase RssA
LCGGGIRGVITAVVVDALDKISQRRYKLRIWDLVDEMIGTSTGAIVAALLCCGVEPKRILKLYMTEGRMIFPTDGLLPQIRQVVAAPRYDPTLRAALVRRYLGNRALNDQSVYVGRARPKLNTFQMGKCTTRVWTEHDPVSFADVLTAASAAPTYFPSHRIGAHLYCDAGLCENHPGMQVMLEGPGAVGGVVCIGTGESVVDVERLANKGVLGWATSMTSVMMGGAQRLARRVLEANFPQRHVHLNPMLPRFGDFDLDQVESAVPLLQLARDYVSENTKELEHAVTVLWEARSGHAT